MHSADMSNEELMRFAALHKHWIAADAVQHHLRRSMDRRSQRTTGPRPVKGDGRTALDLCGPRSLVWITLCGHRGVSRPRLSGRGDRCLLANEAMVSALRRFRNATFHFQATPFSNKLIDFLTQKQTRYRSGSSIGPFGTFSKR